MRKTVLIILFIFCLLPAARICSASDNYWIDPNGDDTAEGTEGAPWQHLPYGITHGDSLSNDFILNLKEGTYGPNTTFTYGSSKNDDVIVVHGDTTDSNLVVYLTSDYYAFSFSSWTAGSLTFENMTIRSLNTIIRRLFNATAASDGPTELIFNHCIIGIPEDETAGNQQVFYYTYIGNKTERPQRKITISNSWVYGKGNVDNLLIHDVNTLTVSDSNINGLNTATDSTNSCIRLGHDIGTVTVNTGSIIKSWGMGIIDNDVNQAFDTLTIDNVTFDCNDNAILVEDYAQSVNLTNITSNAGIRLGHVYTEPDNWTTAVLGDIYISNVNVNKTNTDLTKNLFGLALGLNTKRAQVYDSNFTNPYGIALSLKSQCENFGDVDIQRDIFRGGNSGDLHCAYVRSAKRFNIENCEFYGTGNKCIYFFDQSGIYIPDGTNTDYFNFKYNIVDASGGSTYSLVVLGSSQHATINKNCYVRGSTGIFSYMEVDYELSAWRNLWNSVGVGGSKSNDRDSIERDECPLCLRDPIKMRTGDSIGKELIK